jgi:hypothetical protein
MQKSKGTLKTIKNGRTERRYAPYGDKPERQETKPDIKIKNVYIAGEVLDLTATSANNKYGKEKLEYSMKYGISYPLEKYIHELDMIIADNASSIIKDDKQSKRQLRLEFLNKCNENEFLQIYFQKMCNYLNGGDGNIDTQHENTPLIIVCAGGNIITIFAKLLQNLIDYIRNIEPLYITNEILLSEILPELLPELLQKDFISKLSEELIYIINNISNNNFSDFDFNIVMNKNIFNSDEVENEPVSIFNRFDKIVGLAGFLLIRDKSTTVYEKTFDPNDPDIKYYNNNPCKNIPGMPDILYTQVFQDAMIAHVNEQPKYVNGENIPETNKSNCLKYLEYLKEKKNIISQTTKFNTNHIINKWKTKFGFNTELDAIVNYIHTVNQVLNNSLITYINLQINNQYTKDYYDLWKSKFSTLETMFQTVSFNNKTYSLPDIMSNLLFEFLRNDDLQTKVIMEINDLEQDKLRIKIDSTFNIYNKVNTMVKKIGNKTLANLDNIDNTLTTAAKQLRTDIRNEINKIPTYNTYLTLNTIITNGEDSPEVENKKLDNDDQSYIVKITNTTKGGKNKNKTKRKQKQNKTKTKTK